MKKSLMLFLCVFFILGGVLGWTQNLNEPLPLPQGARILRPGDQGHRPAIYAGPFTAAPIWIRSGSCSTHHTNHGPTAVTSRIILKPPLSSFLWEIPCR